MDERSFIKRKDRDRSLAGNLLGNDVSVIWNSVDTELLTPSTRGQ